MIMDRAVNHGLRDKRDKGRTPQEFDEDRPRDDNLSYKGISCHWHRTKGSVELPMLGN